MGNRILYILGAASVVLLAWNHESFTAPREEGFVYIPLAGAAAVAAVAALFASIAFLKTRSFRFDALAVASTEVGLTFLAAGIVAGCCLTGYGSGRWWSWDSGLTTALVCWLLYAAYLMLRHSVEELSQRATFGAVWQVFVFLDMPLVAATTSWWKSGTRIPTDWTLPRVWTLVALVLAGIVLVVVRMRQEEVRRELDSIRRAVHII